MKVTTGSRAREDGDGKWTIWGIPALCLLALLAGCDKKAVEQAQQEAREAKTAVQQLKHNLGLAEKEIANMKAELNAVRQSRDELQGSIDRVVQERDAALGLVQKANETLTASSSGQTSTTAALQKQIAELNALVAEQQKLIDQYEKSADVEPAGLPPDDVPPTDPNEGL